VSAKKRGSGSTGSAPQNGKLKIELEFEDAVKAALETPPDEKPRVAAKRPRPKKGLPR
jgi:hypothetical protein